MSFFKKLASLFSSSGSRQNADILMVTVKCLRCGETIPGRVNLLSELSLDYESGNRTTYFCRKVLMGTERCFQRVELELTFDENRKLLEKKVTGGTFVEA
jgi:hypothetical protein